MIRKWPHWMPAKCETVPLVSVVIPTRDRPEATARAVRSALQQSHRKLEVIVIDDGSSAPEQTRQALLSLQDPRVSIHVQGHNLGANSARNRGVRLSAGEYVAFLDSDDEWYQEKISRQLAVLYEAGPNTVVYCQARALSLVGTKVVEQIIPLRPIVANETIGDYLFCNRGAMVTPSIVMARALALAVPFDESLKRHQDFAFLLRLEERGCKFVMSHHVLVRVDWRTLAASGRHLHPEYSRAFLKSFGNRLSIRARSGFWFRNVVLPFLFAGERRRALWLAVTFPLTAVHLAMQPRELLKTFIFILFPKSFSHAILKYSGRLKSSDTSPGTRTVER